MTWLNPIAFAWLALIPVIILLHSLRHRRRDVRVSTLFLWESVAREIQGALGWRRLVQNLPLLLQLLLVLLLTAALAKPVRTTAVTQSKDIVLVIDVSASMQTRTSQGTRFAEAQRRALEILEALPSDRQMALIAAGRQPRVLTFFTNEKALLRQAISDLQADDAPGNMREAVLLALSFTQDASTQEIVVIGDGAYRRLAEVDFPRQHIRHLQIAEGERNVGITRLAFRQLQGADEHYEVLMAVKNFSRHPVEAPLQLTLRRQQVLERQLTLAAGQEEVVVAPLSASFKGVMQAELLVEDDFPLDNRAYGVLEEKSHSWILLVGESNFFLEKLLTSLPGVLVNVAPEITAASLPRLLEANQLIIFNGIQPPPLHTGNFLLLNTSPQDTRLAADGVVAKPRVLDWERQHPLLRFVDLTDLSVEEALVHYPQTGGRSLVQGDGTSLMSIIEAPRLRLVTVAFDLMRSDLPLRVAFPVFINNLLRWLRPQQEELAAGQIQAGMPYAVFFDPVVERVSVQTPQGAERNYDVSGNPWVFSDTQKVGVYIMRAGEQKRYLTVNLLDEAESDIHPAESLPSFEPSTGESRVQRTGILETPLWPYLLMGALVALMGEWYVWCRDF
jgi:Ca-activated chloride channel homolog